MNTRIERLEDELEATNEQLAEVEAELQTVQAELAIVRGWEKEWRASALLRSEFADSERSYLAFQRAAISRGKARIIGGQIVR